MLKIIFISILILFNINNTHGDSHFSNITLFQNCANIESLEMPSAKIEKLAFLHKRSFCRGIQDKPEAALSDLYRLIELDNSYTQAYVDIGYFEHEIGNHKKAVVALDYYINSNPSSISALELRGDSLAALGEKDLAVKSYRLVIKLIELEVKWLGLSKNSSPKLEEINKKIKSILGEK